MKTDLAPRMSAPVTRKLFDASTAEQDAKTGVVPASTARYNREGLLCWCALHCGSDARCYADCCDVNGVV